MKKLVLTRLLADETRTLGRLSIYCGLDEQARLVSLEPPWLDNAVSRSCIMAGEYQVRPRTSPKFGDHLELIDVMGRSYILIHRGNFPDDSTGCILVGLRFSDLNSDGRIDVQASSEAMNILVQLVKAPAKLTVVDI